MLDLRNRHVLEKISEAHHILEQCIGHKGVYAGLPRYAQQCWTRDGAIAIFPALLESRRNDVVAQHLRELSLRVRPNGQVPILFLDNPLPFIWDKITRSIRSGSVSFMLCRYLTGNLWQLTPGTKDSEFLYLLAMYEYARVTGDHRLLAQFSDKMHRVLRYIETHLLHEGLVYGCDWRDTMHIELGNTPLLSNNALLYRVYILAGEKEKAESLRRRIQATFWTGKSYRDRPGSDHFDPLGASFAVLHDLVPKECAQSVLNGFDSVDTPHGVTITCKHNPQNYLEAEVIERTQGTVVWPFVAGFTVLALIKLGAHERARTQFEKLARQQGFWEWYDPKDGTGYGASEQLWSATLFLRAYNALLRT